MKKFFLPLVLIGLVFPLVVLAQDNYFNPNFIISDEDFRDYDSLSLDEIQDFLQDYKSPLAQMSFPDYLGVNKRASEIIWQACQESKISPKVILTTLQKEQSLIENIFATQTQLDRAMGYRCFDNALCNPKSLGFGKQVDGAAWQFDQYYKTPSSWSYKVGQSYLLDSLYAITIENQATANLYNYTPHYFGNLSFSNLWQKYWGLNYPDGSLVKLRNESSVWLIQYGQRRPIYSWGVLLSRFDPKKIIPISKTDLEKYTLGPMIKFFNYSLLHIPSGEIYLLVDDELRHIATPEAFRLIGFNWEEVQDVNPSDLVGYKYGQPLTENSVYPTGAILQNRDDNKIYYVQNGVKHLVASKDVLEINFKGKSIIRVASGDLNIFETGDPIKLRDGELIKSKSGSAVYVVSNGYRRAFLSAQSFVKLGYLWDNIIVVDEATIQSIPLGESIK